MKHMLASALATMFFPVAAVRLLIYLGQTEKTANLQVSLTLCILMLILVAICINTSRSAWRSAARVHVTSLGAAIGAMVAISSLLNAGIVAIGVLLFASPTVFGSHLSYWKIIAMLPVKAATIYSALIFDNFWPVCLGVGMLTEWLLYRRFREQAGIEGDNRRSDTSASRSLVQFLHTKSPKDPLN